MLFRHFDDRSVRQKLIRVILTTTVGVLAFTCIILFIFEVESYRAAATRSLMTTASIVAENSSGVLLFDDQKMAREVLNSLRVDPEVSAAALYDKEGKIYATFSSTLETDEFPEHPARDGVMTRGIGITIFQPVLQKSDRVGTLFVRGSMVGTYQRMRLYGIVVFLVGTASIGVAFLLSSFLQRKISEPLAALAATARDVTLRRDYSVRAKKITSDEFGDLTDALNSMLDEIQTSNGAVRASEERFRTLADNMAQLAWMADAEGTVTWYNTRWYDYTGASALEPNSTPENFVHPDHAARVLAKYRSCIANGSVWEDTFPLRGRDGSYRWFLTHALPIRDVAGKVIRWFGTNTDVTELRDTQQEARRARDEAVAASRAKDDFLATLSHELRTPLNPVLLLVSDTQRTAELPPAFRDDFEMIRKNVELEARLIDDMLDLTSITRGKLVLDRRPLIVNAVVRDALATVEPDILAKQIELTLDLDGREPVVLGDPVRLQQVFWNVLKNAVKFSAPGGTVGVRSKLSDSANAFVVEITDHGLGMSPHELERVFDAFVQGDHAVHGAHRFGGLGLGLAISRMLMELHGGKVSASSAGPGCGSTFTIELPLLRAERAVEITPLTNGSVRSDSIGASAANAGLRILLVEDHAPTRFALERLLVRRGHQVISVACLVDAQAVAKRQHFDLLLSDIGLPDGSGHDLMRELRATAAMPGIALTGYGTEEDIALAKGAGFLAHLTKPVRVPMLDQALALAVSAIETARGNAVQ